MTSSSLSPLPPPGSPVHAGDLLPRGFHDRIRPHLHGGDDNLLHDAGYPTLLPAVGRHGAACFQEGGGDGGELLPGGVRRGREDGVQTRGVLEGEPVFLRLVSFLLSLVPVVLH